MTTTNKTPSTAPEATTPAQAAETPDAAAGEAMAQTEPTTEAPAESATPPEPQEDGGPTGPEPTRFGDWERKGRCIDF